MVCPVCTVAVAAGVGILDSLGVDRIIIGIWFGALILSSVLWMINWMDKRSYHFKFRKLLITVSFYLIFIIPLYFLKNSGEYIMGTGIGEIWGLDRLFFGVIIGSYAFLGGVAFDRYLKKINDNKVVVYYQKVFIPLIILTVASIAAYLIIRINTI